MLRAMSCSSSGGQIVLTLSNPIFLPTAYSPALIYCGRERGWWITCWLKSLLHEEKCRTGSYSGAGEQTQKKSVGQAPIVERANKHTKKKSAGRHLTSEQNGKIITRTRSDVGSERVNTASGIVTYREWRCQMLY